LEAYDALEGDDDERMIFVTDCDYEVAAGTLHGSRNLVITEHADVESDLLLMGALKSAIAELIPDALDTDEALREATVHVLQRSIAVAEPIGRVRKVGRLTGVVFDFDDLRFQRLRSTGSRMPDMERAAEVIVQRTHGCGMSREDLMAAMDEVGGGPEVCNGHDLVAAVKTVLHQDYNVPMAATEALPRLIRMALDERMFEQWSVVRRIRRWERETGRNVLLPASVA